MAASIAKSPFLLEIISLDSSKKDLTLSKIREQYFYHSLSLILPGKNELPTSLLEPFIEQFTYKLHRLPLHCLIEMPFIHGFVKKGALHLMSVNRKLDTDDSASITPDGTLLLSLTKDTYQQLGLEAEKQTPQQCKQDIYVVKINLLHTGFRPGKKGYNRTLWCLKDRLDLVMDVLVSWQPQDEKVCSSSMGVYFVDKCKKVERYNLQQETSVLTSVLCPIINSNEPEGAESGCHYRDVFEWMGALACDIVPDETTDSYISTMTCPQPSSNVPRCCKFQARGLITSETVARFWMSLRAYIVQTQLYPAYLTVHGFSDSIMKNKHEFHNFYIAGNNLYSFVLLPENYCWQYTATAS